ncbi:uncharacterized protein LOC143018396 [Oratosquilla oratoria]|uniref:uncharacterized protein LOC143018396 n=1 Tax=Oratosquilla oratoria TaxID=337810 RepID=UPI003F758931
MLIALGQRFNKPNLIHGTSLAVSRDDSRSIFTVSEHVHALNRDTSLDWPLTAASGRTKKGWKKGSNHQVPSFSAEEHQRTHDSVARLVESHSQCGGEDCHCLQGINSDASEVFGKTGVLYTTEKTLTNVAFQKPSQASKPYGSLSTEYANDEFACSIGTNCCYSSAAGLPQIFWMVDLGAMYRIYRVEALLLGEGAHWFTTFLEVWIGDTDAPTGDFTGYKYLGSFMGPPPPGVSVIFRSENGMTGSYVGIFNPGHFSGGITLCDVRVMAEPV